MSNRVPIKIGAGVSKITINNNKFLGKQVIVHTTDKLGGSIANFCSICSADYYRFTKVENGSNFTAEIVKCPHVTNSIVAYLESVD